MTTNVYNSTNYEISNISRDKRHKLCTNRVLMVLNTDRGNKGSEHVDIYRL